MTYCDKDEATNIIAAAITQHAQQKVLLLLSGGTSAEVGIAALERVAEHVRQHITVMLADERYVQYGSEDSNAVLLKKLGVQRLCREFIETINADNAPMGDAAENYAKQLRQQSEGATIIAVFGVGTDNHTAGIMPNSVAATSNQQVSAYETDVFNRITIAPSFFALINTAFVYATGSSKSAAVEAIEQNYDAVTHPSQFIKQATVWQVLFNKENI